ncbi:hypothetical protein [Roseibium album]|uniref:hypothetical protein n=1 Tax=Roseibium album TaxID=311410 RepID=UPI003BAEDE97
MPRYTKRSRACITDDQRVHEDETFLRDPTVSDHEAAPTGILDSDGNEFMRLPERIGFWWSDDGN